MQSQNLCRPTRYASAAHPMSRGRIMLSTFRPVCACARPRSNGRLSPTRTYQYQRAIGLVRVSDLLVVNLLALSCFLLLKIRNVAGVPPFQRVSRITRKIGRNIVRGPRHSIVPQVFMATPTRGRICHFTLSDYYEWVEHMLWVKGRDPDTRIRGTRGRGIILGCGEHRIIYIPRPLYERCRCSFGNHRCNWTTIDLRWPDERPHFVPFIV